LPQRAGGAGVLGELHRRAGMERHAHPDGAGQLPGGEVDAEPSFVNRPTVVRTGQALQ
jgi:hypothetical protein